MLLDYIYKEKSVFSELKGNKSLDAIVFITKISAHMRLRIGKVLVITALSEKGSKCCCGNLTQPKTSE